MDQLWAWLSFVPWWVWLLIALAIKAIRDIFFMPAHTIKHNFPIVGHLRYWLESIGPEMRQYFVANNREELPFNRIEHGWIYASAKKENNYEKAPVDFTSIHSLETCQYLVGKVKKTSKTTWVMHTFSVMQSFLHRIFRDALKLN